MSNKKDRTNASDPEDAPVSTTASMRATEASCQPAEMKSTEQNSVGKGLAKPLKPHPGKKRKYIPAVTPRLKVFLYLVFGLFSILMANSIYLASITTLEAITQKLYQDYFYIWMFLLHLVLGLLLIVPFIVFIAFHLRATFRRKNRSAVRVGYVLLAICVALLFSGIGLTRNFVDLKSPSIRAIVYWVHVLTPVAAIWLYCIHRLSGPPIKWRIGLRVGLVTSVVVIEWWFFSRRILVILARQGLRRALSTFFRRRLRLRMETSFIKTH